MNKAARGIILIIFVVVNFLPVFSQQNKISITISNIRSDKGIICLALYDHKDQFPHDPSRDYEFSKTLINDSSLEVILSDIPPGIYALSLLDDEDENHKMKYNILRMPKEGYGFSNNVKPRLSSPPFEDCTFIVNEGSTHLEIRIQYFREKS